MTTPPPELATDNQSFHLLRGISKTDTPAMLPSMVRRYSAARRKQTRSQRLQSKCACPNRGPVRSRARQGRSTREDPRARAEIETPVLNNATTRTRTPARLEKPMLS